MVNQTFLRTGVRHRCDFVDKRHSAGAGAAAPFALKQRSRKRPDLGEDRSDSAARADSTRHDARPATGASAHRHSLASSEVRKAGMTRAVVARSPVDNYDPAAYEQPRRLVWRRDNTAERDRSLAPAA